MVKDVEKYSDSGSKITNASEYKIAGYCFIKLIAFLKNPTLK